MPPIMHHRWARLYRGTPAELALEPHVASLGVPYRFQEPLFLGINGPAQRFFPDFVLLAQRVVIEVDDPGHARKVKEDAERTRALELAGWRVVRLTNEEALGPLATEYLRFRLAVAGVTGPWEAPVDTRVPGPAGPAPSTESAPPGRGSPGPGRTRRSPRRRRGP